MGDKIRAQGTSRVILGVRSALITPLITLLTKSHEPLSRVQGRHPQPEEARTPDIPRTETKRVHKHSYYGIRVPKP